MIDVRLGAIVFGPALALGAVLSFTGPTAAATGCCLQRSNASSPWVEISRNFVECEKLNKSEGDDLFAVSGNVRWSLDC